MFSYVKGPLHIGHPVELNHFESLLVSMVQVYGDRFLLLFRAGNIRVLYESCHRLELTAGQAPFEATKSSSLTTMAYSR